MNLANARQAFNLFLSTKQDVKPFLKQIFKQDGKYIATDAHSIILMPNDGVELSAYEPPEEDGYPVISRVLPGSPTCDIKISIAALERALTPEYIPKETICEECEGEGEIYCWHCKNTNKCRECDGRGYFKSENGETMINTKKKYEIAGSILKYDHLKKLVDACNLLDIPEITKTNGDYGKSSMFSNGYVTILLMPSTLGDNEVPVKITANAQL